MPKLLDLIKAIPDEYADIKNRMLACLATSDKMSLHIYVVGLYDMAYRLTSDEAILKPLRNLREVLES